MQIINWNPIREAANLQRDINRLFKTYAEEPDEQSTAAWSPRTDIKETNDNLQMMIELPGVVKDDIKINVNDNILTLSGERKAQKEEKGEKYHRLERVYGMFSRSFELPVNINTEKITAVYREGVLSLTLPKKEESKPKTIKVITT